MNIRDKLEYIIAVITEFANWHHISNQEAYIYLDKYGGLNFVDEYYDVEHTLSFDNVVEDLTNYCKRKGGAII